MKQSVLLSILVMFVCFISGCSQGVPSPTQDNQVPLPPVLTTPLNNAVGQETILNLVWSASVGATSYRVQLATSSAFTTLLVDDATVTATSKNIGPLSNYTTYYWRLNAANNAGVSIFSGVWAFTTTSPLIEMVVVGGGTYTMGSATGYSDELPLHQVTLSGFYISKTEVTQGQWKAVMSGGNPSHFTAVGDSGPVEQVSWFDCISYCNKLSIKEGKTPVYSIGGNTSPSGWTSGLIDRNPSAKGYRLPTEAEWEYAARGGNKSHNYDYSGSNYVDSVAWDDNNSNNTTHRVSTKMPNELGISDMSGNVWEWCWDWYGAYTSVSQTNPVGASSGSSRVVRGGGWIHNNLFCRVSNRLINLSNGWSYYYIGFRVVENL